MPDTHVIIPLDKADQFSYDVRKMLEVHPNKRDLSPDYIKMIANRAAMVQYVMSDRNTESVEWAFAKGYEQAIKDLLKSE